CGCRATVLARAGASGPAAEEIPRRLFGEVQSVAPLVGRLRPRVYALLGAAGSGVYGRGSQLPELRDARGVFTRVHQRRLVAGLAGRPRERASVLCLRIPGAGGVQRGAD